MRWQSEMSQCAGTRQDDCLPGAKARQVHTAQDGLYREVPSEYHHARVARYLAKIAHHEQCALVRFGGDEDGSCCDRVNRSRGSKDGTSSKSRGGDHCLAFEGIEGGRGNGVNIRGGAGMRKNQPAGERECGNEGCSQSDELARRAT